MKPRKFKLFYYPGEYQDCINLTEINDFKILKSFIDAPIVCENSTPILFALNKLEYVYCCNSDLSSYIEKYTEKSLKGYTNLYNNLIKFYDEFYLFELTNGLYTIVNCPVDNFFNTLCISNKSYAVSNLYKFIKRRLHNVQKK